MDFPELVLLMPSYTLLAPAKINLLLEIVGDRSDGYHELVMVMQSVNLADVIHLSPLTSDRIEFECHHPDVPQDKSNLVHKAALLMQSAFPGYGGARISLEKNIPIGAGLAGGSTDAAAVLVGLDLMWNLGLTQAELESLAEELGSDVPFCIGGGTKLALGRGEELSPLADLDHLYAVLAKYRSLSVSTPWAYQTYRQVYADQYANTPEAREARRRQGPSVPLLKALQLNDDAQLGRCLHNDLEKVVLREHPQVQLLKTAFEQQHPLGAMMSGSGPTVFALCSEKEQAEKMANAVEAAISDPDLGVWVAKFCASGIHLLGHS